MNVHPLYKILGSTYVERQTLLKCKSSCLAKSPDVIGQPGLFLPASVSQSVHP